MNKYIILLLALCFGLNNAHEYKTDAHSIVEDFEFVDANSGDYTFTTQSIIDKIGFINIPMDRFGVYNSSLVSKAKKAPLPKLEYNFSMQRCQRNALSRLYDF